MAIMKSQKLDVDESEVAEDGTTMLDPRQRPTVRMVPANRRMVRKEGCWNCKHWDNQELAQAHYRSRRLLDAKALADRGRTLAEIDDVLARLDRMAKPPRTGVCMASGSRADLVFASFKCSKWTGRVRTEGPQDKLADELYDRLGEKLGEKL